MNTKQTYGAVDWFRVIAALLVVAIHTSPLLIFGELPDFVFTRVVARLAVPFFFAATGFFLLGRYASTPQAGISPILKFIKKTLLIYGASIILYLPVNMYTGQLSGTTSFISVMCDLLFKGTMYHLWYLPASILGVIILWLLLRYTTIPVATGASILLYILGLLGDSYYGLIQNIPFAKSFYDTIFLIFGYARNGLFFAPIFLVIGVLLRQKKRLTKSKSFVGFFISLLLMVIEGLLLYTAKLQLHDSMYIMLPICVFFLFSFLLQCKGESRKVLRDTSLIIYIIHPLIIILVRGIAKITHSVPLLVDNSLVHYIFVCVASLCFAIAWQLIFYRFFKKKNQPYIPSRAWIEIDLDAIAHNVETMRRMLPVGCQLMPAVKADAYGLGAVPICQKLNRLGIYHFCVACLAEAITLRKAGIQGEILILGYTAPDNLHFLHKYHLIQTVVDSAYADKLAQYGKPLQVHVKIDTGMHRLGERYQNTAEIVRIFETKNIKINGIFTQLSACDSTLPSDIQYTQQQIRNFEDTLVSIQKAGLSAPNPHIQCSYGIFNYPNLTYTYARPGLALYGVVDKNLCLYDTPPLVPVFAVKCKLALTKTMREGERVGYGQNFIAPQDMRIAVLTMGYADGLPRNLSNQNGNFLVQGHPAPIIGNICMDQAIIDITQIANARAGDTATFIGQSSDACISIQQVASQAQTIPNEIMSRLGQRLEKVYI